MSMQLEARTVLDSATVGTTTKAIVKTDRLSDPIENYSYYISPASTEYAWTPGEVDVVAKTKGGTTKTVRPFMPGGKDGAMADSGVDAYGLLTGSLAMTDFAAEVLDEWGDAPAVTTAGYYAMKAGGTGLDASGKPAYYPASFPLSLRAMRLRPGDLERSSVIVPDISLIRVGDLLVYFGDESSDKKDPSQIGIVVGLSGTPPAYGADGKAYMQNVYVVSVREGFGQVTLGTWGNGGTTFGGFNENPEKFHIRRLLVGKRGASYKAYTAPTWDVCDTSPASASLDVIAMSEHTRNAAGGDDQDAARLALYERWIPNTGEYLAFWNLDVTVKNAAGVVIDIAKAFPKGLEIVPTGAVDRNYDATKSDQGNIYNNKSGADYGFELALMNKERTRFEKIGELHASGGVYAFTATGSAIYNATSMALINKKYGLFVSKEGLVTGTTQSGSDLYLAIRPLSSSAAWPGDDLNLTFGLRIPGETLFFKEDIRTQDSDYVAVYDKKMLWRANLYIDEGTGVDWNELHPWNVPPNGNEGPSWWSATWGHNQWNRTFDGITLGAVGSGDGKQIVKFSSFQWTPVRTKDQVAWNLNYYNDRVAYDYEYSITTFKAMDSPFDFIWKMCHQKLALTSHFAPLLDNMTAVFYSGIGNNTIQSPTGNQYTNIQMEDWSTTKAPYDRWKFYWKEPSDGSRAYIPGLGLRYHSSGGTTETSTDPVADLGFTDKGSAGADCIGFVQRTAGYSGNTYSWIDLPTDLAEGRENPDTAIRNTQYPVENISRVSILSGVEYEASTLAEVRTALLKLIPGDIFTYGPETHIGVIFNIDYSALINAMSTAAILSSIGIIESTYDGPVNYIINTRSLNDISMRDAWSVGRLLSENE